MESISFIHLTDTHFPPQPGERVEGIDPVANLRRVLARVRELAVRPAFLLISGDLSNAGDPESYRHFKVAPAETHNRKVYDLGNGQWNIPALRKALEDVLPKDELFEDYFEELADNLRGASYARMGEERGARERKRVYTFPDQFRAMRDKLARFTARLFENSVYSETVPLRGVYFSSGTQEGRPFNLLFETNASNEQEVVDQKGYFLRDLFMQVIFADSAIASASQAELRRQRFVRTALTSALAVTNSLASAFGAITVPMSRPSRTAPPSWAAKSRWRSSRASRTDE